MRLLPYGPRALLAEFSSLGEVLVAAAALRDASVAGVVDIVPAMRTVLVVHDGADLALVEAALRTGGEELPAPTGTVRLRVHYDGPDLEAVAAAAGLTIDQVVSLHCGTAHRVAFCGFLPGFAYMTGLPAELQLPRRRSPRPLVAAGSVAIADGFTGIYPVDSPGGWHILGSTQVVLWDARREVPGLLVPGADVVFEAV